MDSKGQATLGAYTTDSDFFTLNPLASPYGGANNAVLLRLSSDGTRQLFSTFLGATGIDKIEGLTLDSNGVIYVAGTNTAVSSGALIKVGAKLGSSASPLLTGIDNDTGASAFDHITTSTSPTLRGIAAPSGGIKVRGADGTQIGTATADSSGAWTLSLSGLSEGTYAYTVLKRGKKGQAPNTIDGATAGPGNTPTTTSTT